MRGHGSQTCLHAVVCPSDLVARAIAAAFTRAVATASTFAVATAFTFAVAALSAHVVAASFSRIAHTPFAPGGAPWSARVAVTDGVAGFSPAGIMATASNGPSAVSYTHLTLPTILRV